MKTLRDESGNVLILTALSFTILLSCLAIATDIGSMFYTKHRLQTLADSAAMAAALEIGACGTNHCGVMTTAATAALTEGGSSTPTLFTQCAAASGTGLLLTINNGPCAMGSSDPNNGKTNYVEAVVTLNQPTFFAGIFGISTIQISARAEAGKATADGSGIGMDILGTSGQTLTLNSGANITDQAGDSCGLQVNSSGTPAVMEDSGATVNASSYKVVGSVTDNGGSYTPAPTTGAAAVPDPIQAEINAGTISVPSQPADSPTNTSTVSGATTLQPGYYPSGINFNGSGYTVTLTSGGVYYMGGSVNIGAITINQTGTGGVTIYMASGGLTMNSAANVNLTAPTSGQQAGMVIWQATGDTNAMILDSASNSNWNGAVYVPSAQLTLNGGSTATAYGMVVAQSVMLDSAISLGNCGSGGGNGSTTIALAE